MYYTVDTGKHADPDVVVDACTMRHPLYVEQHTILEAFGTPCRHTHSGSFRCVSGCNWLCDWWYQPKHRKPLDRLS